MTVFELVAKLTLDSSEYEKGIKGANEGASLWGKAFKTAGKVAVAAIGASAAAIGMLTKKSVDAYAEYEQLAGGVEKIFDQANIEQIFEDANNAYKNLNMSANEYLAAINQTGAAFAQTMGDQKGYDTAKRGMQAIADYASGTGRNLNELNDKYALITRSTSSYQSIADQFSGILPATSKGFLEQAQAAGFLSDSYSQLTDVPIDEYQEAVTKMLEKGVTDMGLYGNTAKESATTIQGSLAMTKSAWENLVAGFANPDADMGQLMDNLIVAIVGDKEGEGLLNQIIPAIERAVEGIGKFIEAAVPLLADKLPELIESFLPVLIQSAITLVTSLIKALPSVVSTLVTMLPQIVDMVINGIIDALITATPLLLAELPKLVSSIASGLWNTVGVLISAGSRLIGALSDAIVSALKSLAKKAINQAKKIPQSIKNGLGNLKSIGINLIEGLWGGIKAKFDSVVEKVKALAGKLPKTVKKVLGIASPSKVFAEVGKWIPEGLALGIERNVGSVQDAMDTMSGATEFTPVDNSMEFGNGGNAIYDLINALSSMRVEVVSQIDGKEVARITAPIMSDELNRLEMRASRKLGYV